MSHFTATSRASASTAAEGFTSRMIRLWIEHYERLLGFGNVPL